MTAPTTRGQPASSSVPSGKQAQAQARRKAHSRRKVRAKAKSEALRREEAAHVEALPVLRPHACGIDIGSRSHWVCVGFAAAADSCLIREFPAHTDGLKAIVAFLHVQMDKFAELGGGRRSVEPADLATGNAKSGRAYFSGTGKCSSCHSATGDLAGIGKRLQGLNLIRRMLYPAGGGPGAPRAAQGKATFQLAGGQTIVAPAVAEDDFTVTVLDPLGARQTYQKTAVRVTVEDPLSAHFDQLAKYTDADMHNVYAYLESLK